MLYALRAYLWGIETTSCWDSVLHLYICCEPTYEELKLPTTERVVEEIVSCEPTYEELKQPLFTDSIFDGSGCEPTYEELKLFLIQFFISVEIKLRAYLWGIETYISGRAEKCPGCVASLPMRNWNFNLQQGRDRCKSSCEPTYEELKLSYTEPQMLQLMQLRAYLWGIETFCKFYPKLQLPKLRAYLWGIETLKLCIKLPIHMGCEPTYEELKLDLGMKISKC